MNDDSCIRQEGKHSFWPGKIGTEAGNYCFVTYKPRGPKEGTEGDCRCIDKARKIHTKWKEEVECETKGVAGYVAYHFEKASIEGHCPVSGCYGPGGSDDDVVREYVEVDA